MYLANMSKVRKEQTMASKAKRKKGINSYIWHLGLKSKGKGAKRVDFYTPSDRQKLKKQVKGADDESTL